MVADLEAGVQFQRAAGPVQQPEHRLAPVAVEDHVAVTLKFKTGLHRLLRQAAEHRRPAAIRGQGKHQIQAVFAVLSGPLQPGGAVFLFAVVGELQRRIGFQPQSATASFRPVVGGGAEQPQLLPGIREDEPLPENLLHISPVAAVETDLEPLRIRFDHAGEGDPPGLRAGEAVFKPDHVTVGPAFRLHRPEAAGAEEKIPILVRRIETDPAQKRGERAVRLPDGDGDAPAVVQLVILALIKLRFGGIAAENSKNDKKECKLVHGGIS